MKQSKYACFAVALSGVAAASAIAQDTHPVTSFEPSELQAEAMANPGVAFESGEKIYKTICAACHMPDGEGAVGGGTYPALSGNEKLEYPDYAIFIITNGYKAMPSFGHLLDDDQVAALVNYLQSGLGENAYEPTADAETVALVRPLKETNEGEE